MDMWASLEHELRYKSSNNLDEKDIFKLKPLLCGMIIGIKRSIFMNELLIGTTSLSSATDKNDINISIRYQIFSVLFIL